MKAKRLFANDNPEYARKVSYISALIVMQRKAWAYYSVLVSCGEVIWTRKVPTAGTDGVYIYVNPDFFDGLPNDNQRAFLLAHEVGHIVLRHAMRRLAYVAKGFHSYRGDKRIAFDHQQWNVACDLVINADLVAHGMEMIPEGLLNKQFGRDDLVDDVYVTLYKEPEQDQGKGPEPTPAPRKKSDDDSEDGETGEQSGNETGESSDGESGDESGEGKGKSTDKSENTDESGEGSGSGEGEGEPTPSDHGGHDQHYEPDYSDAGDEVEQEKARKEDEGEIQRQVDEALDAVDDARDRGERHIASSKGFSNAGYRHSGEGSASDTDWRSELADLVTRSGDEGEITWGKLARRRYITTGVCFPTRKGTFERIAITVDISGSVSRYMLHQFLLEMAALIDLMQPSAGVLILWTNTVVESVDEVMSGAELLALEVPCGGGTRMSAAVEWMEEQGLTADVHLCFTDGDLFGMDDWMGLAKGNVIVVLDSQPTTYTRHYIDQSGVRAIVAGD